ncbi:probable serine racemase [Lingula anatina]|uniref:L-serine ammonia-lyase n=1 Tax=Lingula anatina TaxID=7574 RepID=A0A1S3HE35_LINAN|nr:probable serine racemase [Lingula anatina]|eukprot:XP_013383766.1 probable serine racemase [Lingula anatina]
MKLGIEYRHLTEAYERISPHIHKTPIFSSSYINGLVEKKVYFKGEHLQKTGSFKARGALNAVLSLKEKNPENSGVVTHSSGNHGQALAWAARYAGMKCTVVIPSNAPAVKVAAIKDYGADLVFCEPNPMSRQETCAKISAEKNQTIIPSFDYLDVIAGEGSIGIELMEQVPDLEAILVPISGGGMISGICIAAKAVKPDIKIFACEPKGKDLEYSLKAGKPMWPDPPKFVDTIADGLRVQRLGTLTFPVVLELVEKDVFTTSDDDIIEAMKLVYQRMKQVIEPSSGVGVAALLSDKMKKLTPDMKKVGVILCGGNTDIEHLPWMK